MYICSNCGVKFSKWVGQCSGCKEWNTIDDDYDVQEVKKLVAEQSSYIDFKKASDLVSSESKVTQRFCTGFNELDRVLGGGFVEGEVILISGDPGIGKSTLLLQVSVNISKTENVLYVTGEESLDQVGGRLTRVSGVIPSNLSMASTTSLQNIFISLKKSSAKFVVLDSIQTVYDESIEGLPGSSTQIKRCAVKLIEYAKQNKVTLIIVGHITKLGVIAGPKLLEHLVDCVLQFEGSDEHEYRVLRSIKNRFGSTGEVGVFEMNYNGLSDSNPSNGLFEVEGYDNSVGIAKVFVKEGSRNFFIDIQSLVSKTIFAYPKRVSEGVSNSRLQLISAILEKHKVVNSYEKDIFVKTTGGYEIKKTPYADLGIAASLLSSDRDRPFKSKYIFIGEVALNGSVSTSKSVLGFVNEANKLFPEYSFVLSSNSKVKGLDRVEYIKNVTDLLKLLS